MTPRPRRENRPRWLAPALLIATLLTLLGPAPASARPAPRERLAADRPALLDEERPSFLVTGANTTSNYDTSWYGGTVWAADSNRWEAIPGGTWTFDSGVGSWLQPVGDPYGKPAGYHRMMEGWGGREMLRTVEGTFRRMTTCAIAGSYSMWIGFTQAEADSAGWCSGQGYGNSWSSELTRTFNYPGSGDVTLQYQYAVDSEPGFDYLYTYVQPSGAAAPTLLRTHDGAAQGADTIVLRQNDGTLPASAGTVTVSFLATSDGGYSDEDGFYPSTCGLAAIDNITLSGAISHSANFESGLDGWESRVVDTAETEYSDLRDISTLPPVTGFYCSDCGFQDSVLVFLDPHGSHPANQYEHVLSPWIDLRAGGDVGSIGHLIEMNVWAGYYVSPTVPMIWQYYPYLTCSGKIGVSPLFFSNIFFYGNPYCGRLRYQYNIPSGAEQVRVGLAPYPTDVLTNPFPYYDNVRFGAFGPTTAPNVSVDYLLQDNFPTDGTLNPASPGRVDNSVGYAQYPLGDTLVVNAGGANVETRVVFQVRPGPLTSAAGLATAAARWTAEPTIGAGWYSARMDTAERGGSRTAGSYMSCFHESDPGFLGHDTDLDPTDPGHLANDIWPDNLFTPGSRLDYFVMARYIPPDPRNPGGQSWFVMPDTTGGNYWEMEILPSSMAADSSMNCVLVIDAHNSESAADHRLEESALTFALGAGGRNAEGTRFDRYDIQTSGRPFGRPAGGTFGASLAQAGGYRTILWYSGHSSAGSPTAEDVAILDPWLTGAPTRGFWGNGVDFASRAHQSGGTVRAFLNGALGTNFLCLSVRSAGCPAGSAADSSWCLPLAPAVGAAFGAFGPASVAGNGCPELRGFDVVAPMAASPGARGNRSYLKGGLPADYASVTNEVIGGNSWRSVVDGFPVADLRRSPADPHSPALCSNTTAVYERTLEVLSWLATPDCPVAAVSAVPEPPAPAEPAPRPRLGDASPNPMTSITTIRFTTVVDRAPAELRIFDVTGRPVRSFASNPLPPGDHAVTWDGTNDAGRRVPSGLYFYRFSTAGFSETKKLVVR